MTGETLQRDDFVSSSPYLDPPARADYAPSAAPGTQGAVVQSVAEGSPAWQAGLEPGMVVLSLIHI